MSERHRREYAGSLVNLYPLPFLLASIVMCVALLIGLSGVPSGPVAVRAAALRRQPSGTRASNAAMLKSIPIAPTPIAGVVDTRDRRVFVLSSKTVPGGEQSSQPGVLTILDAAHGTVLHAVPVGRSPSGIAVDERTGRVFVLNMGAVRAQGPPYYGNGQVMMLDAATGTSQRRAAVGIEPVSLVIDEQRGRVFIADEASSDLIQDGGLCAPPADQRALHQKRCGGRPVPCAPACKAQNASACYRKAEEQGSRHSGPPIAAQVAAVATPRAM